MDLAADRVRRVIIDAGEFECFAVSPSCMAIDSAQPNGAVGYDLVNRCSSRKFFHGPQNLVPAAALDPAGARVGFVVGGNPGDGFFETFRARYVQLYVQEALARYVAVSIDQAGQHVEPLAIDSICVRVLGHEAVIARRNNMAILANHKDRKFNQSVVAAGVSGNGMKHRFSGSGDLRNPEDCGASCYFYNVFQLVILHWWHFSSNFQHAFFVR